MPGQRSQSGCRDPVSRKRIALFLSLTVCLLLASAAAAHAQPLTSIPGSPFIFGPGDSEVTLLSPDETHLFVSNVYPNTVTVLNVAADGSLTYQGTYGT